MATIPDEKVNQLMNDVTEIKTLLKGYNGYPGLCKSHEDLQREFYKFRNRATAVFLFLLGSGCLGVGIYKIIPYVVK